MNSRHQHRGESAGSSLRKILRRGIKAMRLRGRDKRRFPRYDCMVPVEIHVDSPGQVSIINAEAHNISAGGMLLKCSTVLESFTHCHVSFRVPDWFPRAHQEEEVMAAAKVLRVSAAGLTLGIAFNHPL